MDKSISFIGSQIENLSLQANNGSLNRSGMMISLASKNGHKTKTPSKSLHPNSTSTPSRNHPSNKTPSRHRNSKENQRGTTKNSPKTPANGDRFITDRSAMNFDLSNYLVNNIDASHPNENTKANTISEVYGDLSNYRIMTYQNQAPLPPEGHANDAKVVYSCTKSTKSKKSSRYIPKQPERILDAPDIKNDYYLQLLDWNNNNILAVALNNEVYLWNAKDGSIENLLTLQNDEDYVASLSWAPSSPNHIAVGLSTGVTQIWDINKKQRLRYLNNCSSRISCLCWNSYILSNGSKDGNIYNHDVRIASSLIGSLQGHSLEICGLKWSPNGRLLASGGNDNTVNVWPNCYLGQSDQNRTVEPLLRLTDHQAAVKALAWCPWRTNCLASGGGTNDRMIRIWNTDSGQCSYKVNARSQVSAILWSSEYRELISSHGFANNELIIWKYPTFEKVIELTGHTARILGMAMSADGTTVVSLGADETLRFWECFEVDPKKKKAAQITESKKKDNVTLNIRLR